MFIMKTKHLQVSWNSLTSLDGKWTSEVVMDTEGYDDQAMPKIMSPSLV